MPLTLHLTDTAGSEGVETALIHLVEGLTERGWESRVLVPRLDWLLGQFVGRRLNCRIVESRGKVSSRIILDLIGEIKEFPPHLIHAHFTGSGVYGTTSLSNRPPLTCTFHGTPDVNPVDRMLGLKARVLCRARNRVVYVSHYLRRHLEPIPGVLPHLGEIIHSGTPKPGEVPAEATPPLAGLRPAKHYPGLLRDAQPVFGADPRAESLIEGGGSEEVFQDLRNLEQRLGIGGSAHFLGFRSDVRSIPAAIEVFVSSSETEELPLAGVEAMAMGKPEVLTNCGGVPEVLEDGQTGLPVPVRAPQAPADGVLRLLGKRRSAERLGPGKRKRVMTALSLQSMLDGYTKLYEDLLAL